MLEIPPCFRVIHASSPVDDERAIVLRPGHAFGCGRHETTQLCLQAIGHFAPRPPRPWRLLDVGSGSGILSIGAAKLGATAFGVELDASANALAEENARLSGVSDRATFSQRFPDAPASFDVVVANILCDILVELAERVVAMKTAAGTLVLSGLLSTDVPVVSAAYARWLDGRRPEIYQRGEWRALAWRRR